MNYSLNQLYEVAGLSKQAVYKQHVKEEEFNRKLSSLVIEADILKSEHPGCGVEKMYHTLRPEFMGRDKFVEIFMELGFRVKRKKNYQRTTFPGQIRYPNMIEGALINRANQLWQSDITYFRIGDRFYYLVFILDVFTRKIVGYHVSDSLRAEANLKALKMAMKQRTNISLEGLIHHSDRGSQYGNKRYTELLKNKGIRISMGEKAQSNAYAERINGIIKNEYLNHKRIDSFAKLKRETRKAVNHYNSKRIHGALPGRTTPGDFEISLLNLANKNTAGMIIYAEKNKKIKPTYGQLDLLTDKNNYFCPILLS